MAQSFDVRALPGRTLGAVFDEIAPGWSGSLGFTEGGPVDDTTLIAGDYSDEEIQAAAAIRRKVSPITGALRARAVVLVDINGAEVPLWIWFRGGWRFYRDDERQVEWLVAKTAAGERIEYYTRELTRPAAKGGDKKRAVRTGRRGNTEYDDTDAVELARAVLETMAKPSKRRAAALAVAQLIAEKHPVVGTSPEAWAERIRKDL